MENPGNYQYNGIPDSILPVTSCAAPLHLTWMDEETLQIVINGPRPKQQAGLAEAILHYGLLGLCL